MSATDKKALRHHGGGHLNHSLWWTTLGATKTVDHKLLTGITAKWRSLDIFKTEFSLTAANIFGSGWAWLVRRPDQSIEIFTTANQDSPLRYGYQPIFGLDVWEHAYYLKYQNRRPEYIQAWWHVLKLLP
jgi:Fe-Mn family superoxide dismutase